MAYQTIEERKINVFSKIGNRQDCLQPAPGSGNTYSRISGWLRDAYISVAMGVSFEQTEKTQEILLVPGNDTYAYPSSIRAVKSLVGIRQDSGAAVIVDWKDINYVRRYSTTNAAQGKPGTGTPSIVAAFGFNLVFRPIPDTAGPYLFYLDYWANPVITDDVDSTSLLIPDDWLELVDYEAAARAHTELLERDKAREIQSLLYGFTDPSGKVTPGLLQKLMNRRQAMAPTMDYGMEPKYKTPYGRGGR